MNQGPITRRHHEPGQPTRPWVGNASTVRPLAAGVLTLQPPLPPRMDSAGFRGPTRIRRKQGSSAETRDGSSENTSMGSCGRLAYGESKALACHQGATSGSPAEISQQGEVAATRPQPARRANSSSGQPRRWPAGSPPAAGGGAQRPHPGPRRPSLSSKPDWRAAPAVASCS